MLCTIFKKCSYLVRSPIYAGENPLDINMSSEVHLPYLKYTKNKSLESHLSVKEENRLKT